MKYGDSRGIKTRQWFTNEILRQEDINRIGLETYQNIVDSFLTMSRFPFDAEVPKGLNVTFVTGLTAVLKAGVAISHSGSYMNGNAWGFVADPDESFVVLVPEDVPLAFDTGVGQPVDRVDIVEIRPIEVNVDSVSRNFKDPITSLISSAIVPTGKHYTYEMAIRKGSGGVTPVTTAGWIKVAEVSIAVGVSTLTQNMIKGIGLSRWWTREAGLTRSNWGTNREEVRRAGRALSGRDLLKANMKLVPAATTPVALSGVAWDSKRLIAVACASTLPASPGGNSNGLLTIIPTSGMMSPVTTGLTDEWQSIAYSEFLDCLVVVGAGANPLAYSLTGPGTLTAATGVTGALYKVRWIDRIKKFIAVGNGVAYYSSNGVDWTACTGLSTRQWRDLVDSPELGIVVAISQDYNTSGTRDNIAWSLDGITWTKLATTPTLDPFSAIDWSSDDLEFIALTSSGTVRAFRSSDGLNWVDLVSEGGLSPNTRENYVIKHIPDMGMWLAMGNGWLMNSPDGTHWWSTIFNIPKDYSSAPAGVAKDFVWVSEWGTYIAVTSTGQVILPSREASLLWGMQPAWDSFVSTIMARDSAGRARVEAPVDVKDIANKDYVDLSERFDIVINSNAKFDEWAADTSGLLKRVLIKKGTWTRSFASGGINFATTGTEYIRGEVGSVLDITSPGNNTLFLGASTRMRPSVLRIEGMTVKVTGGSSSDTFKVFSGCSNLSNCHVILEGSFGGFATANHGTAFYNCFGISQSVVDIQNAAPNAKIVGYCKNLTDVIVNFISNSGTVTGTNCGFEACTTLTGCEVNYLSGFVGDNATDNYGFYQGDNYSNCKVYSDVLYMNMQLFAYCQLLSVCMAEVVSTGASVGITGFSNCDNLSVCRAEIKKGSGAAGGLCGFHTCRYLSGCWSYITASGTAASSVFGYRYCDFVSSCMGAAFQSTATVTVIFENCENLSSCKGSTPSCNIAGTIAAFQLCVTVVGCLGVATNLGAGAGYGFYQCSQCQQNGPVSASKTATYNTCYADTSTTAVAFTAAGGFNRLT